jgi:hypothetical protein
MKSGLDTTSGPFLRYLQFRRIPPELIIRICNAVAKIHFYWISSNECRYVYIYIQHKDTEAQRI